LDKTEPLFKRRIALAACLMEDYEGHTPLYYALESQNTAIIQCIFKCLMTAFSPDFCRFSREDARQNHLPDLFPLAECIDIKDEYPAMVLKLVARFKLIDSYESIVKKGCEKAPLGEHEFKVLGSEERTPSEFWRENFYHLKEKSKKFKMGDTVRVKYGTGNFTTYFEGSVSGANLDNTFNIEFDDGVDNNVRKERIQLVVAGGDEGWGVGGADDGGMLSMTSVPSDVQEEDKVAPVTAKLVPFKNAVGKGSELLAAVVHAAESTNKYDVFDNEVLQAIIDFKWNSHVKWKFLKHIALDLVMVFSYSFGAYLSTFKANRDNPWALFPTLVTMVLWMYFVRHEMRQFYYENDKLTAMHPTMFLRAGFRHIMGTVWNFLDFWSLTMIAVTSVLRIMRFIYFLNNGYEMKSWVTFNSIGFGFGLPFVYINLLKYMQGFQQSGELVSMIIGIMAGIKMFILILITVIVGFTFGFYVLARGGDGLYDNEMGTVGLFSEYSHNATTYLGLGDVKDFEAGMLNVESMEFKGSMLGAYALMLGAFDVEEFAGFSNWYAAVALFVVFTFFVNIVMLNLLIAIMGDVSALPTHRTRTRHTHTHLWPRI